MTMLPKPQHSTTSAIFAQYERMAERGGRPHLGASEIGHECERYLWLSFRWTKDAIFEGRMLRLFATGNQQESRLVADLRSIGCTVSDADQDGQQWRYSAIGGHFGGSMDAAVLGIPEAPKTWHVAEFKTSNTKGFAALTKSGVKRTKPQHYAQMQMYMGWSGMDRALYMVVCKDTDELYSERIEFDRAYFEQMLARAKRIINDQAPGVKMLADSYSCKYCRFQQVCHGTEAPQVNCRTCCHSTPEQTGNGTWSCARDKQDMTTSNQRKGCADHRHIPQLLEQFAEVIDAPGDNVIRYTNKITGAEFVQPTYSSQEITDCADKSQLGDKFTDELKSIFAAEVKPLDDDLVSDMPWLEPVKTISYKSAKKTRSRSAG